MSTALFRAGRLPAVLLFAGLLLGVPIRQGARAFERVRAPDFDGATDFIGTSRPFSLKELRGKVVILEFWTLC
jgi:hypothetical protein